MGGERSQPRLTLAVLSIAGLAYAVLSASVVPALPTIAEDLPASENGITFLLTGPVRVLAVRLGAVAWPRGRDVHSTPTPRWGGLALFDFSRIADSERGERRQTRDRSCKAERMDRKRLHQQNRIRRRHLAHRSSPSSAFVGLLEIYPEVRLVDGWRPAQLFRKSREQ